MNDHDYQAEAARLLPCLYPWEIDEQAPNDARCDTYAPKYMKWCEHCMSRAAVAQALRAAAQRYNDDCMWCRYGDHPVAVGCCPIHEVEEFTKRVEAKIRAAAESAARPLRAALREALDAEDDGTETVDEADDRRARHRALLTDAPPASEEGK